MSIKIIKKVSHSHTLFETFLSVSKTSERHNSLDLTHTAVAIKALSPFKTTDIIFKSLVDTYKKSENTLEKFACSVFCMQPANC
jgi:hypothetical protein